MSVFLQKLNKQLVVVLGMPLLALAAFLLIPSPAVKAQSQGCSPGICAVNGCTVPDPPTKPHSQLCNAQGTAWLTCGSC